MASPRVVIIGAGIVGAGLADELTARGWTDVTVVDPGPPMPLATGLVLQVNESKALTDCARSTVETSGGLRLDGQPCFREVGSLEIATTPERLADLRRRLGLATSWGVDGRLLDPDECARAWPLLDRDAVVGGLLIFSDGLLDVARASEALARRASERGARLVHGTAVTGIRTSGGRVAAVLTDDGQIRADIVVSCAGIRGPRIAAMVGMRLPVVAVARLGVTTTALPVSQAPAVSTPILRHADRHLDVREAAAGRLVIGTPGHRPFPTEPTTSVPNVGPDEVAAAWSSVRALIPALRESGVEVQGGIDDVLTVTPDGFPLLGESPAVAGLWVAEAVSVSHSAGVARAMAEWLVEGAPRRDVHESDAARFDPHQESPAHIAARGIQAHLAADDIRRPLQRPDGARPLRTSPFYGRQDELGAVFGEAGGWERPEWFATNAELVDRYADRIPGRSSWASRDWSPIAAAEALATRERVAMFDLTPLKRIVVSGPGACAFLERVMTNTIDRPVGSVVYTLMLDERGGIRSALTVARLKPDKFQIGANGNLDQAWLRRHAPTDGSVHIESTTAGTCGVGLWGPRARDVVAGLVSADVSNEAFPYRSVRDTYLDQVPVRMLRLSGVGELGWEIYTPSDMGLRLWDTLWEAGQAHGIIAAGRSAFASLRLEKGYRSWGTDLTTEHDPDEAGLRFAVRMDKGDFLGRAALAGRSDAMVTRRLTCLTLDRPTDVVTGKEPILADGTVAGYVTSAGFGYTVGRSIAYGWLPAALTEIGRPVEIDSYGERLPATVAPEPLFDPAMTRLHS